MMRLLIILFLSIFVSNSAFSQTNKFGDEKVEKWLKQADRYLPDFHRDSVISVYPIYQFSSKKEYWKIQFSNIPTSYSEIDSLMDYEHLVINEILAKTTNGIWRLTGFDSTKKIYCGYRNSNALDKLFNYLDSVKAYKAYHLFGMFDLTLIEKDGKRTMIKEMENTWQECEISDLVDLEDWNIWYFPTKEKRLPPVIGY